MTTGFIAALIAVLVLGFIEGLRRFYPAHATWWRIRRTHGRRAARAMRERYEAAARRSTPRRLATLLLCLVISWVAIAGLLDKRWNEVLLDVTPYVFIWVALFRTPGALTAIAERMRGYERSAGEDPDKSFDDGDGGPTAIAL